MHYNHGQNIVDKFTKLNKIGVSLECFTANFSPLSSTTVKVRLFCGCLGKSHLRSFGNSWGNFYIHLLVMGNCGKRGKVYKYRVHNCLKTFFYFLVMCGNSKTDSFFVKKDKTYLQMLPCCTCNDF